MFLFVVSARTNKRHHHQRSSPFRAALVVARFRGRRICVPNGQQPWQRGIRIDANPASSASGNTCHPGVRPSWVCANGGCARRGTNNNPNLKDYAVWAHRAPYIQIKCVIGGIESELAKGQPIGDASRFKARGDTNAVLKWRHTPPAGVRLPAAACTGAGAGPRGSGEPSPPPPPQRRGPERDATPPPKRAGPRGNFARRVGHNTQFAGPRAAGRFSAPRGETLLLLPPRPSQTYTRARWQ